MDWAAIFADRVLREGAGVGGWWVDCWVLGAGCLVFTCMDDGDAMGRAY